MARDRVNTGFGPSEIVVTGTTATADESAWARWGPVKAVNVVCFAKFSTASSAGNTVKLRTWISTASTRGQQSFTVIKSSAQTATAWGSTGMVCYIQGYSSVLANTRSVTLYVAGVI